MRVCRATSRYFFVLTGGWSENDLFRRGAFLLSSLALFARPISDRHGTADKAFGSNTFFIRSLNPVVLWGTVLPSSQTRSVYGHGTHPNPGILASDRTPPPHLDGRASAGVIPDSSDHVSELHNLALTCAIPVSDGTGGGSTELAYPSCLLRRSRGGR